MKNAKFIIKRIIHCSLFVVHCSLLSGCVLQTKHRGFIFPSDIETIVAGAKTTRDLETTLGSPQARTAHGGDVWIYYGADENYRGPLPLTYDNKKALLVWADKSGKITKRRILTDADFPDVRIDGNETPIPAVIELNVFEEMINNIGRFTPAGLGQ